MGQAAGGAHEIDWRSGIRECMRIAILSDIHGNRTALEAVIADLRITAPDQVLHGGDLADSGSSPVEVVDCVRDCGWEGVLGNTDEMLIRPETLEDFARQSKAPPALWGAIRTIASASRAVLGEERLGWMRTLPRVIREPGFALVHAQPGNCWIAPSGEASDSELQDIYGPLAAPVVVYGHTHVPSIRQLPGMPRWLVNMGSVGLPYDGDPRASYAIIDEGVPTIRRVVYDVQRELQILIDSGWPGAEWTAKMLRSSAAAMP